MTLDEEVLNATADGWSSLDQIFVCVRDEFLSDLYDPKRPDILHLRDRYPFLTMAEIVAIIRRLVNDGHLDARREDKDLSREIDSDDVVHGWFHVTATGRSVLASADE